MTGRIIIPSVIQEYCPVTTVEYTHSLRKLLGPVGSHQDLLRPFL